MLSHKGNSIIEVIVVIVILSLGIIGAFSILNSGQKLSNTTENRIKAINIAREGIEAVQNIRDSNWIKFSSDYEHCWNTLNYDSTCIGGSPGYRINKLLSTTGSYILLQNGSSWTLSGVNIDGTITPSAVYTTYKTQFPISYDSDGLATQNSSATKCNTYTSTGCLSIFTREITISYPDTNNSDTSNKMEVHSIVKWRDNSKYDTYTVNLTTILTNWKKGF